jgi:hypothetical protein
MASNSTTLSCQQIDNTFHYYAQGCRGAFDFTLLFEETILAALPVGLLVLLAPPRIWHLLKRPKKVVDSFLLPLKIVCWSEFFSSQVKTNFFLI